MKQFFELLQFIVNIGLLLNVGMALIEKNRIKQCVYLLWAILIVVLCRQ